MADIQSLGIALGGQKCRLVSSQVVDSSVSKHTSAVLFTFCSLSSYAKDSLINGTRSNIDDFDY